MNKNCFIIAIDGTCASGKGTLSKKLAAHYGFDFLDTGKLYRKAALAVMENNINHEVESDIAECLKTLDFTIDNVHKLDSDDIGNLASKISVYPEVRKCLDSIQKNFPYGRRGVVIDGRDIGTVIFPDADIKLYVTAGIEKRAERRFKQLQNMGKAVIFDDILRDLRERDERDSTRKVAPLKAAADAIHIDTSLLDPDSVLDLVITLTHHAVDANFQEKVA